MGRKAKVRRNAYGAWLHHLRVEKKMTQQEMADLLGVPRSNLAYWERTGNLPGRLIILKMSAALGLSANRLLRTDKFDPQKQ